VNVYIIYLLKKYSKLFI